MTAAEDADITDSGRLAISYNRFAQMCQPGDQLFVGRYLVNGADQSSLYLEVNSDRSHYRQMSIGQPIVQRLCKLGHGSFTQNIMQSSHCVFMAYVTANRSQCSTVADAARPCMLEICM